MKFAARVLKSAVEGNPHLRGNVGRRGVHGKAVKDEHVAGIDTTADPPIAEQCGGRDLRDVKIFPFVLLDSKAMGTGENAQWTDLDRAVVQGNPCREEFRVTTHEFVVLMRVDYEA